VLKKKRKRKKKNHPKTNRFDSDCNAGMIAANKKKKPAGGGKKGETDKRASVKRRGKQGERSLIPKWGATKEKSLE